MTYINKDELVDTVLDGKANYSKDELLYIINRISKKEIVNCFECKHYRPLSECLLWQRTKIRPYTDYCSRGERKEKVKQFERDEIMPNYLKAEISTRTRKPV